MTISYSCEVCPRVFRHAGEVRVWLGLCGCSIRPEVRRWEGAEPGYTAEGWGARASAPVELEAVRLWRLALEVRQRETDRQVRAMLDEWEAKKRARGNDR